MPSAVHVTTVHRPFDNRIFLRQCASLRDAGWKVTLIAQHSGDQTVDGIRIRALPQESNPWRRIRTLPRIAARMALREAGDITHFHDPELLPIAHRMRRRGHAVVYDMHENIVKDIQTKAWIVPPLRFLVSALVGIGIRRWLRDLPVIFAEESYHGDYPFVSRSEVILNLPRPETLHSIREDKHQRPTLAYMGGITRNRGSCLMFQALGILQAEGREVGLELVGPIDPDHDKELDALAASLGLQHIRRHGFLRADSGWPLLAKCHVGLALLSRLPNYVDSYPSKIFEYMALGLPVVASDFKLYRSLVEKSGAGLCAPPEDPEAVAKVIRRLLDDPISMQEMGAAGRKASMDRYRWDVEERKLLSFYAQLLRDRETEASGDPPSGRPE